MSLKQLKLGPPVGLLSLALVLTSCSDFSPPTNSNSPIDETPAFSLSGIEDDIPSHGSGIYLLMAPNQATRDPNKQALMQDVRFRKALSHVMNRQTLVETSTRPLGESPLTTLVVPAGSYFHNADADAAMYNPSLASALLTQIGLEDIDGDGFRENLDGSQLEITFSHNSAANLKPMIEAELAAVGIRADVIDPVGSSFAWIAENAICRGIFDVNIYQLAMGSFNLFEKLRGGARYNSPIHMIIQEAAMWNVSRDPALPSGFRDGFCAIGQGVPASEQPPLVRTQFDFDYEAVHTSYFDEAFSATPDYLTLRVIGNELQDMLVNSHTIIPLITSHQYAATSRGVFSLYAMFGGYTHPNPAFSVPVNVFGLDPADNVALAEPLEAVIRILIDNGLDGLEARTPLSAADKQEARTLMHEFRQEAHNRLSSTNNDLVIALHEAANLILLDLEMNL